MKTHSLVLAAGLIAGCFVEVARSDWPTWRHDAARSGATLEALPRELHLQWVRELPPPRRAWPASQVKLQFDAGYEPVVAGGRMFVGSTVNDSVAAYDAATGQELWRFYTDGPVRFAPAVADGRVYAVSDDGHLYCLFAADGRLAWKLDGGPPDRRLIIGNDRLISTWPARGGVVVEGGVCYFAAGIWPSMGVFVRAVDAKSGRLLWTNSDSSSLFITHPHGADSFGSISPQGYLAVSGDALLVPGGRTLPAVFDRRSGRLAHFQFGSKGAGSDRVIACAGFYLCGTQMCRLSDGRSVLNLSAPPAVHYDGRLFAAESGGRTLVLTSTTGSTRQVEVKDRRGKTQKEEVFTPDHVAKLALTEPGEVLLAAGSRVYVGGKGRVAAYDIEDGLKHKTAAAPDWSAPLDGEAWSMLAADGRLFVVTREANILCFGENASAEPTRWGLETTEFTSAAIERETAETLTALAGTAEGYAVVLGVASDDLPAELARVSRFQIAAVDSRAEVVARLRRRLDSAGLYGMRVCALAAEPHAAPLPPYLASLIVVEAFTAELSANLGRMFETLRPYGGTACIRTTEAEHRRLVEAAAAASLANAEIGRQGPWSVVRRVGPLPEAGVWTHQYGDASHSAISRDKRVKAPLGVLWFGGPSNDKVLPRHGHGPSPQVAGGRLFIEGPDMLRAVDVYTGRVWWERELPGIGAFYDNTSHQPGAGEIGSNYVSLEDHVYVAYQRTILELDARTGETTRVFRLDPEGAGVDPHWGALLVSGEVLLACASPVTIAPEERPQSFRDALQDVPHSAASRQLVAFHRPSGRLLWRRPARYSFRHNAVCAGAGKVFCIDGMSPAKLDLLRRRGVATPGEQELLALEVHTGDVVWRTTADVFGTFLNYSVDHDVLLQGGSAYRDRAKDEVDRGLVAYRGSDGSVVWKDLDIKYGGPCLLWKDTIITNGAGGFQLELSTGKPTGWTYRRMYGCNTVIGSEHLLTFRSGAAGFFDLACGSGTGNLGGFRSSCTSNLIPADGVLNAPDFTRTCTCAYQLQSSLAFIHMPEAEFWTFNEPDLALDALSGLGINLGAPGDRRDDAGVLWLEYPLVGGPSPPIDLAVEPKSAVWFRRHTALLPEGRYRWVGASGVEGVRSLRIKLPKSLLGKPLTVTLVFAEPAEARPGERVFDVALQGKTVLSSFDVSRFAGGAAAVVREFPVAPLHEALKLSFTPTDGAPNSEPVLSGVAVVAK